MNAQQIDVLVFEADDAFRRTVSERLLLEGVRALEAADDAEAMEIALSRNVDVVLLGGKEIRRRAFQFLKFIRKSKPMTEVILMTPANEHSLATSIEAMKLGAFDDLVAPFDIETLLDRIHAAGKRKRENEKAF